MGVLMGVLRVGTRARYALVLVLGGVFGAVLLAVPTGIRGGTRRYSSVPEDGTRRRNVFTSW
jgi:hypothetical protein